MGRPIFCAPSPFGPYYDEEPDLVPLDHPAMKEALAKCAAHERRKAKKEQS